MVDVFGEVDEQIRSDRLHTLVQRAWPFFLGALAAAILVVLGVWGYGQYRAGQSAKASEAYNAALDTEQKGDVAKAFDQFGVVAKGSGAYVALALMQQAGIRMDQNKPAEAAALFDKVARASSNPMIADAAGMKAAYALMDTAPLAQIVDRLTPLAKPERPYHAEAREALAMARVAAGQMKEAKAELIALGLLTDTPDSMRSRAQAITALIDSGTAGQLKRLAQQALTAAPIPVGPPQAGPSQDPAQGDPQGPPEAAQ